MGISKRLWQLLIPGKQNSWELGVPKLIITTVLLLLVGGAATFGIGIVYLNSSELPNPPPQVKTDSTFYLLLSQSLVNFLTSLCTVSGIVRGGLNEDNVLILVPICLSVIFAIAAPPTYAATKIIEVENQTNGMVVSFVSSVFAVVAAVFSSNVAKY